MFFFIEDQHFSLRIFFDEQGDKRCVNNDYRKKHDLLGWRCCRAATVRLAELLLLC